MQQAPKPKPKPQPKPAPTIPKDCASDATRPGYVDVSESFGDGAIVQVKRIGPDAHVEVRLPSEKPRGSVTLYVQGTVEELAA
jgi:hypothetical protein